MENEGQGQGEVESEGEGDSEEATEYGQTNANSKMPFFSNWFSPGAAEKKCKIDDANCKDDSNTEFYKRLSEKSEHWEEDDKSYFNKLVEAGRNLSVSTISKMLKRSITGFNPF